MANKPFDDIFSIVSTAGDGKAVLRSKAGVNICNVDVPNPLSLILCPHSEATVFIDDAQLYFINWVNNMSRFVKLFESPDFFAQKYRRDGHKAVLFFGGNGGVVWGWTYSFPTHGFILRALRGFANNPKDSSLKDGLHFIGKEMAYEDLDVNLCGAILPKQGKAGSLYEVGSTYVSMWYPDGEKLRPEINQIIQEIGAEGPVLFDKNVGGGIDGPWKVVPW